MKIIRSDICYDGGHRFERLETAGFTLLGSRGNASSQQSDPVNLSQTLDRQSRLTDTYSLYSRQTAQQANECSGPPVPSFSEKLISGMVQHFTGSSANLSTTASPAIPVDTWESGAVLQRQNSQESLRVRFLETRSLIEKEETFLATTGVIATDSGLEINFELNLQMARTFRSRETLLRDVSVGALTDPLVITMDGGPPRLTDTVFSFDLDADGTLEEVGTLAGGSGLLSLDVNGDGMINNGSELFGPMTGNGFLELARHDADGNRWIDENDPVFHRLTVWRKDEAGNDSLTGLQDAGIGAIYLGAAATPFSMTDGENRILAMLRQTGVLVREDGSVQHIYQLDLADRKEPQSPPPHEGDAAIVEIAPGASGDPSDIPGTLLLGFETPQEQTFEDSPMQQMVEQAKERFQKLHEEIKKIQELGRRRITEAAEQARRQYGFRRGGVFTQSAPLHFHSYDDR